MKGNNSKPRIEDFTCIWIRGLIYKLQLYNANAKTQGTITNRKGRHKQVGSATSTRSINSQRNGGES